jgi:phosphoesterase RecJ-like protein
MNRRGSATEIAHRLEGVQRALVTTHVSPDGDAVGSALAMAALMRMRGAQDVEVVMEDPVPDIYTWLEGAEAVVPPAHISVAPEVVVLVDANRLARSGTVAEALPEGVPVVTIDHHADDAPDGEVVFLDPSYAAVGEMVAEIYEAAGVAMDRAAAEAIYVAITTDTGNFRYPSTTAQTHRWAARCMEAGVNATTIASRVFDCMRLGRFNLMRYVLGNLRFTHEGATAYAEVTPAVFEETGAKPEDLNNLINLGRDVEGVRVAVLFRAMDTGETKASLRACPGFNAAAVAKAFGGGGHAGAAGCTLEMPLDQARDAVLARIGDDLRQAAS